MGVKVQLCLLIFASPLCFEKRLLKRFANNFSNKVPCVFFFFFFFFFVKIQNQMKKSVEKHSERVFPIVSLSFEYSTIFSIIFRSITNGSFLSFPQATYGR